MGQGVSFGHSSQLVQTAHRDLECEDPLILYQADVPQSEQCPCIQIWCFACFLGAVGAKQTAFQRIKIKRRPIVDAAIPAAE